MIDTSLEELGIRAIHVGEDSTEMGQMAARNIASELRQRLNTQAGIRIIFAAAPSQSEMLAALVQESNIDWTRITAFHMDEYLGLDRNAPQRFSLWLRCAIFDRLPFAAVHLIEPDDDLEGAIADYTRALSEKPIDLVCLGIGANGHLAFNDPPADFKDPKAVKVVSLDDACRQQQVDDGCFAHFDDVPTRALTLTIPRLLTADRLFCCAPGRLKREAVRRTIQDPIGPDCPATALRLHPNCILYLNRESAADLR